MPLGFIKLPRTLLEDPEWKELSLICQHIFLVILQHASYKTSKFDVFGVIVDIEPGELCISYERLSELCHKGIDKKIAERAVKKLIKCGFLRLKVSQKMTRKKSIFCISRSDVYKHCFSKSDSQNVPESVPQVSHKCPINKEVKKDKKVKEEHIIPIGDISISDQNLSLSADADVVLDLFISHLKKLKIICNLKNDIKVPQNLESWRKEIKNLIKTQDLQEVKDVIEWLSTEDFWRIHILSPKKLKEKYVQLVLKKNQTKNKTTGASNGNTRQNIRDEQMQRWIKANGDPNAGIEVL